ncbi:MAG: mechanosensitive ion channel [Devosia sp.]|uniref:mechanosensitive ion channel domain-containing protein n=1 Tax=Devosia sp. TaxID=1871048 RepID=UPI0024C6FE66|nr:mechanosensitive ion channel domain-containing protein [Devosia sp.]UYN98398.1 MAG: mechanosensitive ion channel [Devosia sp.]
MRALFVLLFALLFSVASAHAQDAAGTAPSEPVAQETAVDDLIRILEDDTARAELIERLRQAAPEGGTAAGTGAEDPAAAEDTALPDLNIARQIAEYTRNVAEGASTTIRSLGAAFGNVQDIFSGVSSADGEALRTLAINIGIVLVGLFGSYFLLRLLVGFVAHRIAEAVRDQSTLRRLGGLLVVTLVEAGAILLAWALGYILALNTGPIPSGQMGINQTLLLNAFLVVEMSKLVLRTLLMPRYPPLRMVPVTDTNAAYWSFWIDRIISLLGYAFMFVAPMLAANVSPAASNAVQVLAMTTAVIIGVVVVLQNKDDVRLWLTEMSLRRDNDGLGRLLVAIGQFWHIVVIGYLLVLLVVWFANPETALPFMIGATVQSLIAIAIAAFVITFISRFVSGGLRVPDDVRLRLPMLEQRLQAFVPRVMLIVRVVVIAAAVIAVGQAWNLFDFNGWISSDEGAQVAGSIVSAAFIVLVAVALHLIAESWVEYRMNADPTKTLSPRELTLLNLFKNAFTIALVVFAIMLALAQIGVNIAPLLAGAGVVGLAIGFGAQKLVQDIITGIFIQFENIMNVGDVVGVGDKSGVVEKLTIRSVTIRDMTGTVHLIPFSSVDLVSNMMRGFSFHVAEIGVAYDSDIAEVKQAMFDAFDLLMETELGEQILDVLDMQGVTAFGDSAITVRARIKTLPGMQWGVGRRYNELVKQVFSERNIEIPYPHVTYVPSGGGGGGKTPKPPIIESEARNKGDDEGKP